MKNIEEYKKLVEILFYEVWNEGKLELLDKVFSDNVVIYLGRETYSGRKTWRGFVKDWRIAFPDIKYAILDLLAAEDKIICRWDAIGTHLGIFNGISPTKNKIFFDGITIFRAESGTFTEVWLCANVQQLMQCIQSS